jgi:hypothetical protein
VKTLKESEKNPNQILCHEIEPNLSKDRAMHEGYNPSFSDEFIKSIPYRCIMAGACAQYYEEIFVTHFYQTFLCLNCDGDRFVVAWILY